MENQNLCNHIEKEKITSCCKKDTNLLKNQD